MPLVLNPSAELKRALSEGGRDFSFTRQVNVLRTAHALTLLSTNGPNPRQPTFLGLTRWC